MPLYTFASRILSALVIIVFSVLIIAWWMLKQSILPIIFLLFLLSCCLFLLWQSRKFQIHIEVRKFDNYDLSAKYSYNYILPIASFIDKKANVFDGLEEEYDLQHETIITEQNVTRLYKRLNLYRSSPDF